MKALIILLLFCFSCSYTLQQREAYTDALYFKGKLPAPGKPLPESVSDRDFENRRLGLIFGLIAGITITMAIK